MANNNKVFMVGYIATGKDENGERKPLNLRTIGEKETAVLKFSLAVPRDRKGSDGKRVYDYPEMVVFGKTAEFVAQYFKPGDIITIDGSIQTRTWTDKEGTKRYTTEVLVANAGFPLGKVNEDDTAKTAAPKAAPAKKTPTPANDDFEEIEEDDLPF